MIYLIDSIWYKTPLSLFLWLLPLPLKINTSPFLQWLSMTNFPSTPHKYHGNFFFINSISGWGIGGSGWRLKMRFNPTRNLWFFGILKWKLRKIEYAMKSQRIIGLNFKKMVIYNSIKIMKNLITEILFWRRQVKGSFNGG